MIHFRSSGANLRDYRRGLGETQAQFAAACGIDRVALSRAETNRNSLSLSAIGSVARRLGVPIDDLVEEVHDGNGDDGPTRSAPPAPAGAR